MIGEGRRRRSTAGREEEAEQAQAPSPPLTVTSAQGVFSPSSVMGSGSLTPAEAGQSNGG